VSTRKNHFAVITGNEKNNMVNAIEHIQL